MKKIFLTLLAVILLLLANCGDDAESYEVRLMKYKKKLQAHYKGKWYSDEYCFMSADVRITKSMPKNPNDFPALICEVIKNDVTFYYYNPDGSGPFEGNTYEFHPNRYSFMFGFNNDSDFVVIGGFGSGGTSIGNIDIITSTWIGIGNSLDIYKWGDFDYMEKVQANYKGKWYSPTYCFTSADIFAVDIGDEETKNKNDSPALICEVIKNKVTFYYYNPDGSGPFKGNTYSTNPRAYSLEFGFNNDSDFIRRGEIHSVGNASFGIAYTFFSIPSLTVYIYKWEDF